MGAEGVKLRGFSGGDFKEIIDHPPTMNLVKGEERGWYVKGIWQNEPLSRDDFLDIMIKQLQNDLRILKGEQFFVLRLKKRNVMKMPLFFIEQAV